MQESQRSSEAAPRPRVWPVMVIATLLGSAGLVRLIVGLIRMSEPPREQAGQTPGGGFSARSILTFAVVQSAIYAGIAIVAGVASGRPMRERLGLVASKYSWGQFALASAALFCLGQAGYSAAVLAGADRLSQVGATDSRMGSTTPLMFIALVAALAASGAIEELFYRGFIQTRLSERWGPWPAIVITATAFGLKHADLVHSAIMIVFGLLLGWLVEAAGSIRPAIVAHVANNVLSCVWTRFLPEEPTPTGHAMIFAIGLVIAGVCWARLRGSSAPVERPRQFAGG